MIEHVEDLPARLDSIALPEPEVLEDGHVQVLEARVAEDVAAHVSKLTETVRGKECLAVRGGVAATDCQGSRVHSVSRALGSVCRGNCIGHKNSAAWVI